MHWHYRSINLRRREQTLCHVNVVVCATTTWKTEVGRQRSLSEEPRPLVGLSGTVTAFEPHSSVASVRQSASELMHRGYLKARANGG